MAICNNCGAEIPEEGKFCMKCGTPREVQPVIEPQVAQYEQPVAEPQAAQYEQPVAEPQAVQYEQPVAEPQAVQYEQPVAEPQAVQYEQPVVEPEVVQYEQPQGFQTIQSDFVTPEIAPVQSDLTTPEIAPAQTGFNTVPTYENQSAFEPITPVQPAFQAMPSTQTFSAIPQEPKKAKKGPIIAFISIAVVAIAAIVIALIMLLSPNVAEIDLTKYITVQYDGTDSVGTAIVTYDKTQLLIDILKEQGEDPSDANSGKVSLTMNALLNSIELEVSQTDGLSNGDKITVTIKYDSLLMEENDIEFTKESKEFTVENLTELIEIDPFEDVTVQFKGTSPNGYASITNESDIDCVRWATMEFDNNSELKNGDTVTLRIDPTSESYAVEKGYKFTATSKEYTVEGLDFYYESMDEISDEHMKQYREKADKVVEDTKSWTYYGEITDVECIGTYFAKSTIYASNNLVIFVYTATLTSTEGSFDPTTIYIPVSMRVTCVEDGKLGSLYGYTSGYMFTEVGYGSFNGFVSGDVMYTKYIMEELVDESDYEITASDDMPEFKETTDENTLPAPAQAQTPTEGTTEGTGETTTEQPSEEETTTQSKPGSIF